MVVLILFIILIPCSDFAAILLTGDIVGVRNSKSSPARNYELEADVNSLSHLAWNFDIKEHGHRYNGALS